MHEEFAKERKSSADIQKTKMREEESYERCLWHIETHHALPLEPKNSDTK